MDHDQGYPAPPWKDAGHDAAGGTDTPAGSRDRSSMPGKTGPTWNEARNARRLNTHLKADVRRNGPARIPAVITDLSVTGFRLESQDQLRIDTVIWVRIPPLAALKAQVRWIRGYEAGCEFEVPLHEAVLDHVAAHRA